MTDRSVLLAAGLLGVTGVALGALGAHALKAQLLERGMSAAWETAARYHIVHAVALVGFAGWLRSQPAAKPRQIERWTSLCWIVGTCLFSGSIYLLAVGGPRWLGPITPLGGIALMIGWSLLIVRAVKREP